MEAIEELPLEAGHVFSDEEFFAFCQRNPDLRFEREPGGKLIIMPNTGGKTGKINFRLYNLFFLGWKKRKAVRCSTRQRHFGYQMAAPVRRMWLGYSLIAGTPSPNGNRIGPPMRQFPPLCPDFIIELQSATDTLKTAKAKMLDVWMQNGCRLAWLIDPKTQMTHIFRANGEIQIIDGFDKTLSGEDVLIGFTLPLSRL